MDFLNANCEIFAIYVKKFLIFVNMKILAKNTAQIF